MSLFKIRFYFDKAVNRLERERASSQLVAMQAVYEAVASANNGENFPHFQKRSAALRAIINGENSEKPAATSDNLNRLRNQLVAAGARIAHSPLSK